MDGVAYSWLFLYPLLVSYLFYLGLRELNMLYSDYIGNLSPPDIWLNDNGRGSVADQIRFWLLRGVLFVRSTGNCLYIMASVLCYISVSLYSVGIS